MAQGEIMNDNQQQTIYEKHIEVSMSQENKNGTDQ